MIKVNLLQKQEQNALQLQKTVQAASVLQMDIQELHTWLLRQAEENPLFDLDMIEKQIAKLRGNQTDAKREEGKTEEADWERIQADWEDRRFYQQNDENDGMDAWDISADENSLSEYLRSQVLLDLKNEKDRYCMEYLIESLDEKGYLTEPADELARIIGVSEEEILGYIRLLQSLEPAGVGAGDLRECLCLQLARMQEKGKIPEEESELAQSLVTHDLERLSRQHFSQIAKARAKDSEEIKGAYQLLQSLNPIPGNSFAKRSEMRYLRADVAVVRFAGRLEVVVNDQELPRIMLHPEYRRMMQQENDPEICAYFGEKLKQLEWVRECVSKRSETLRRLAEEIVMRQRIFFENSGGGRSPLSLRDLADALSLDESTVSRAMRNKFLQCTRGVYPMSYFLMRKLPEADTGTFCGTEQIKNRIQGLIASENSIKPLSDQRLSEYLQTEGIRISRRTVTKYRMELGIPDAAGRKQRSEGT